MKAEFSHSGVFGRPGQGKRSEVCFSIKPEGDIEKALFRICRGGSIAREVNVGEDGSIYVQFTTAPGKF